MLVSLDMGTFIITKKKLGIFTFSEWAENLIFLKNNEIKKNSLSDQKTLFRRKKIPHTGDTKSLDQCW